MIVYNTYVTVRQCILLEKAILSVILFIAYMASHFFYLILNWYFSSGNIEIKIHLKTKAHGQHSSKKVTESMKTTAD